MFFFNSIVFHAKFLGFYLHSSTCFVVFSAKLLHFPCIGGFFEKAHSHLPCDVAPFFPKLIVHTFHHDPFIHNGCPLVIGNGCCDHFLIAIFLFMFLTIIAMFFLWVEAHQGVLFWQIKVLFESPYLV